MVVVREEQQQQQSQQKQQQDADADDNSASSSSLGSSSEELFKILQVGQEAALLAGKTIRDALSSRTRRRDDDNNNDNNALLLRDLSTTTKNNQKQQQLQHSLSTDLVTETDHKCEELIIEKIHEYYPNDKIIGEETSSSSGGIRYELTDDPTWTIDPIDGTTNFVHGLKLSCILISYLINQDVMVGITYDPYGDELFYAIKGHGSYMIQSASEKIIISTTTTTTGTGTNSTNNNTSCRIFVSQTQSLTEAVISMDPGYGRTQESVTKYCNIQRQILLRGIRNIRVFGCTGINMAYVACGRLDGGFEIGSWQSDLGPKIWDFAAGKLLVEEAGGMTIDLEHHSNNNDDDNGNKSINDDSSDDEGTLSPPLDLLKRSFFCAANQKLANEIMQAIREC